MSKKTADFSRRDFLKTAGAVGLGSMLSPIENLAYAQGLSAASESKQRVVPTKPFGNTGVNVSILGLGGAFSPSNQLLLKQAVNLGVTYWDTAYMYRGGKSEKSIGKYFKKYPEDRKKVFLVTKAMSGPPAMANSLEISLKRMNVSYIDLFFFHALQDPEWQLTKDVKDWAEKAKAEGKIRFFGFSTHKNMEDDLLAAAKLGWIDGIMLSYNFRVMHTERMKKAVDACFNAGIGLTAMKTQATGGYGTTKVIPDEKEQNLFDQLKTKGLTIEQAKLKSVWDDHRIASICSHMTNMKILADNVSAAMEDKTLSDQDNNLLKQYACETASNCCIGCARICEPAINNEVPISDVMRYLMYARSYCESERSRALFKNLPSKVKKRMANLDYSMAEQKCPQRMQIGRLMHEAVIELA
jgi:hypothetical protein